MKTTHPDFHFSLASTPRGDLKTPARRARRRWGALGGVMLAALVAPPAAFAAANFVYHERTSANPGCGSGPYVDVLSPTAGQNVTVRFKVEYQFGTDRVRVYYTTDGSNPSGAFGVPAGTTQVLVGSYDCTFGGPVVDVASATIPAQPHGTTVKYIVSAWKDLDGPEIFANSGTCGGCPTADDSSEATVFSYTVPDVVICQVYGGGGNSGAPFNADFVELFNRGSSAVSLAGFSVQYASSAGSTWSVASLSGSIAANSYYLVQMSSAGANGVALPAPDATASPVIAMGGTAGKVALVNSTTALSGTCPTGGPILDFVGYGAAANCSETSPTADLSNTTAAMRRNCSFTDTGNNSADFQVGTPVPHNSASPASALPAINCPANITQGIDPGVCNAVVTWAPPAASGSPAPTVACTPASGSVFGPGTTTVTCTAANACGSASCSFTVTVLDTVPPVVGNPTGLAVGAGGIVTYTPPTGTDNCGGPVTVVCTPPSGTVFPAGTTLIKCTGTDASGNSTASFNNCNVADNGNGTVDLPPMGGGCQYLSPDDVHMILDGLPPGTTIRIGAAHREFFNVTRTPLPDGREQEAFSSLVALHLEGGGMLAGFARDITIPNVQCLSQIGPRLPGTVQTFDTEMLAIQGQIIGDPDFHLLRITAGSSFGLPSPGHTTLTQLPGGNWAVDSFFDITYRIDFVGAPGGALAGQSGSTTATIRMQAGSLSSLTAVVVPAVDVTPPVIVCPVIALGSAAGGAGAPVNFTVTATDNGATVTPVCVPPSGSTFPVGQTTVNCTATDAAGNTATCSFTVTVAKETFFETDTLPPGLDDPNGAGGQYVSPEDFHIALASGILITNASHSGFLSPRQESFVAAAGVACPDGVLHEFDSTVSFDISLDNGATFTRVSAPANVEVCVTQTSAPGVEPRTFDTEMLQLNIIGGSLPPGILIRESPTRASTGKTTIRTVEGGYMISSFFDIFTELSVDDGANWQPAPNAAHMGLERLPVEVTVPSPNLPPLNGAYVSPQDYHTLLAQGIVLNDPSHDRFTQNSPPPPLGVSAVHEFGSQVHFSLEDGTPVSAPAQVRVQVTHTRDDADGKMHFETEMLQLDIMGGSLPPQVRLRKSPTRASTGKTTIAANPDGTFRIGSFFDIFVEVSMDGGQTWLPPVGAPSDPVPMELILPPPAIDVQPQDAAVECGGSATFSVVATGSPPLSYQWYVDGNPVGPNAPTLTLTGLSLADDGSVITVDVSNAAGTTTSADALLTVTDTLPPVLTLCPANISVPSAGPSGSVVDYAAPSATDACDGPVPVTCNPPSGSTFPNGTITVTCTATDSATPPHEASCSFTITVFVGGGSLQALIDATPAGGILDVPAGVYTCGVVAKDLTIRGVGLVVVHGCSPALTVSAGFVSVSGMTFTTATPDPTILVNGTGSLKMRNCIFQESSHPTAQPAIRVLNTGTCDLGVTGDLGGNTINVNSPGSLMDNSAPGALPALGNTWQNNTVPVSDGFALEDQIHHALDALFVGLVRYYADNVYVTVNSSSIQRGIDAASTGDTVNIQPGTYTVDSADATAIGKSVTLAPGASPGKVILNGDLTLDLGDAIAFELNGTTPGTDHDQLCINGAVTLGGATLSATAGFSYADCDTLTLIDNDGADAVAGAFAGLPAGATVTISGQDFKIFYDRGTGNDVVLKKDTTPPTIGACPADIVLVDTGAPGEIATWTDPTATDNCAPAPTVVCSPASGGTFFAGVTIVTCTATDGVGLTDSCTFRVVVCAGTPATTYVDDGYVGLLAGTAVNFPHDGNPGPHVVGCDAFATVQGGVNAVSAGGTVNVAAGSYAENVAVAKALSLLGANAGTACGAVRVAESIVAGGLGIAIDLQADGVTVDGFELTGATGIRSIGQDGFVLRNNRVTAGALGFDLQTISTAISAFTVRDNCILLIAQELPTLPAPTPTIGINLLAVSGALAPTILDNNVSGAFYGYLVYDVTTTAATVIDGGTINGVMQGIAILNINPLTLAAFAPSTVTVDGVSMSGFTGTSTVAARNFHAGVYVFTGGADTTAIITATVRDVTVTGTGKPQSNSAGLSFADFSTGAGVRQDIDVNGCTISNNKNRGIFVSGGNAKVDVFQCTLANNGADPVGTGGNPGFGIIARNKSVVSVTETFVTNPAAQVGFSVIALAADASLPADGPTLTVSNSAIDNNGNPAGTLAQQSAGTLNASGNWLGDNSLTAITPLITGVVDYTPFLDVGTDTSATTGFQGDFDTVIVHTLNAQTGAGGRIQEGIDLTTDPGTVKIASGTYPETPDTSLKSVSLVLGATPGLVTINGDLTLDANDTLVFDELNGTTPGVDQDQVVVNGVVTLGGATLSAASAGLLDCASLTLIVNDLADAVSGTFAGLPNGSIVTISGQGFRIFYDRGDGNDVVLVKDSTGPVISGCPLGISLGTDPGVCSAIATYAPTALDACDGAVAVVCVPASGFAFPLGSTPVLCTSTDSVGNSSTCAFNVVVTDDDAPVISGCPAGFSVSTDPGVCTAVVTYTPTALDNCDGAVAVVCVPASGTAFLVGTTTVNCTATDAAANTHECSFTVTVNDTQAPTIVCPANISVDADNFMSCGKIVTFIPATTDNCPGEVAICTPPSGSLFPLGVTTVDCFAQDAAGNQSAGAPVSCSFTVTVRDYSGDVTVPCWRGRPNATYQQWIFSTSSAGPVAPERTDNAGGPTASITFAPPGTGWVDQDAFSFGCFQGAWDLGPGGAITLTIPNVPPSPTDKYKYVRVQVTQFRLAPLYDLAVVDVPGATIVGVPSVTVLRNNQGALLGEWVVETSVWRFPNCPATETVTITGPVVIPPGFQFATVVDQVVVDTLCQDFECPPDVGPMPAEPGQCSRAGVTWTVPAADACEVLGVVCMADLGMGPVVVSPAGTTFPVGVTPVNCAVTDAENQTFTCAFTVTITDNENPTITCPPAVTVQCASLVPPADFAGGSATDNCGIASVVALPDVVTPGTCANRFSIARTYQATDVNGNMATCVQTITVNDTTPPTLAAGSIATCYLTVGDAETAAIVATAASDNCGGAVTLSASTVGTCNAVITVTGMDVCGNTASVTYNTRIDNVAPAIASVAAVETQPNVGTVSVLNCANLTVQGTVTITVLASDDCGLTGAPTLQLVNGGTVTLTGVEGPPGTFTYTWLVDCTTANGTWTATVTAADGCQTDVETFTLCVNTTQITGLVELQGFVGTCAAALPRTVTFKATDGFGVVLQTWTLPIVNAAGSTFPYTLTGVPAGTVNLSAKTDWTLRRRLPVGAFVSCAAGVNFTGPAGQLKGGDIVSTPALTANIVNLPDYSALAANFGKCYGGCGSCVVQTPGAAVADINGDGVVNVFDYNLLALNWFTTGDPE